LGPWKAQGAKEFFEGDCEYYDGRGCRRACRVMTDDDRVVRLIWGRGRHRARKSSSKATASTTTAGVAAGRVE
ncbi:hypothetical protein C7E12_22650, partial [Stenotrophomonas maltophilia]